MNYKAQIQKFLFSQYLYAGTRMALAILIPSLVLAYFGLLKEYFLFPLATSFIGFADQPGPFIRRRNSLILAVLAFSVAALLASVFKSHPSLALVGIIVLSLIFSLVGIYGQRLMAIGSLSLVVLSIFLDGHLIGDNLVKSIVIYTLGSLWFVLVFLVMSKLQPYKLAEQMIGENYLQLAEYLQIRTKFYLPLPDYTTLYREVISKQIEIKNLQEETRELVFKTRTLVNESTTTSRVLMLLFLNSIDLYEKLFTTDQNYEKIQKQFHDQNILPYIRHYLMGLSEEITNIGLALQSGIKTHPIHNIEHEHDLVYNAYFELRNHQLTAQNLSQFMALRLILKRLTELKDQIKAIYRVLEQDTKIAKSLSSGLDLDKFVPKEAPLKLSILRDNLSLESAHFRHSIRLTVALVIGYLVSQFSFLGIGHSYWILITILAIMRPAYSATKHRNLRRLYGTILGAITAYVLLQFVVSPGVLLAVMLGCMILCFALLKGKYSWAVFFMTVYIFIAFNFLNPGNVNGIFKDRILDTAIGALIVFVVSYFVLPLWEHTQNLDLMKKLSRSNKAYFEKVVDILENGQTDIQLYKLRRKEAMIDLANLSDNFQRMLSDPKKEQYKLQKVHQFVNTSHLFTAYTASLAQYAQEQPQFPEIDFENWLKRISFELEMTQWLLKGDNLAEAPTPVHDLKPRDSVKPLLEKRQTEIQENEFYNLRDPQKISYLTTLTSVQEILELIFDVAREQRKTIEKYMKID